MRCHQRLSKPFPLTERDLMYFPAFSKEAIALLLFPRSMNTAPDMSIHWPRIGTHLSDFFAMIEVRTGKTLLPQRS